MLDSASRSSVTHHHAPQHVVVAARVAERRGKSPSRAIVDESRRPRSFLVQDGAPHSTVQVVHDKISSALSGRPAHRWDGHLTEGGLRGLGDSSALDRFVTLGDRGLQNAK